MFKCNLIGGIVNKIIFLCGVTGALATIVACAPRRDRLCTGNYLKSCEPAIYFAFDSSSIGEQDASNFDWVAEKLKRYEDRTVFVRGHSDLVGNARYNQILSERRAKVVAEELIKRGIEPKKITIRGMGMSAPITMEKSEQHLNRRVDITFGHRPSALQEFFSKYF